MKKEKQNKKRRFDFRIKYNAEASPLAVDSFHFYNAYDAQEALSFHEDMMKKKNLSMQTLSVEKFNPYSEKWEIEEGDSVIC